MLLRKYGQISRLSLLLGIFNHLMKYNTLTRVLGIVRSETRQSWEKEKEIRKGHQRWEIHKHIISFTFSFSIRFVKENGLNLFLVEDLDELICCKSKTWNKNYVYNSYFGRIFYGTYKFKTIFRTFSIEKDIREFG